VGFRPKLFIAIFIEVGDLLDGRPAKNGVVADKWGDIAVGDSEADSSVDEISEEGDSKTC
jgi:hypothetical protein